MQVATEENYLVVFYSEHIGAASEAEVKASCKAAGGRMLQYHPKIGTVVAASAFSSFAAAVKAQVKMSAVRAPVKSSPLSRSS